MEELNKKLKSKAKGTYIPLIIVAIILLAGGGLLLGAAFATASSEYREMSDYSEYQLQTGDYYKLSDYNMVIDSFAEDSDGEYFIIYRNWDEKWMALYLKGADKTKAEAIMEENWAYLDGTSDSFSSQTISVKGRLRKMDSDEEDFFRQWMESGGWSAEEIVSEADFRTLDTSDSLIGMYVMGGILAAIGLGLLIFSIRGFFGGGYQKKVMARIQEKGISPERISYDLSNGTNYKNLTVTPSFVLLSGTSAEILFYDELVWVYGQTHTTVHKLYGIIPTGKTVTHNVLFVDRDNKTHTGSCKNEEESGQIITQINTFAPYLVTGYSEEIAQLAQGDFAGMVRYVDEKRTGF